MRRHIPRVAILSLILVSFGCSKGKSSEPGVARAAVAGGGGSGSAAKPRPTPRGAEHAVFSLVDNRMLAHVQRGGGIVALAGHPGFAKYTRFAKPSLKWKLNQQADGHAVAIPEMYAMADLPLTAEQAAAAKEVGVRVKAPDARRMTIIVNGKQAATVELTPGWQTARAPLAAGMVKAGENTVQLVPAKGPELAVEWIQLGGELADATPPLYDKAQHALVVPQGGGLAYYVMVPQQGRLVADVVGAGCELAVSAREQGGGKVEGTLKGEAAALELQPLAGKIVRLDLVTTGCAEARLTNAELAVPGAAPVVTKPKKPKHIVFWIMDSLRADRVRTFTPGARPEVPFFDKLLASAAMFRACYSQGNETRASHAAIWSSQYAVNHQMIRDGATLASKWTTLGETMKAAGLQTVGNTANGYIWKKYGFGDGWDLYHNHIHEGGGVKGADVLAYSIGMIEKLIAQKSTFLFMGTIDTHVSWRAREPWFSKYDPEPYTGRFKTEASGKDIELVATGKLKITERDKTRIRAIYDSNVSYQDDLLGKLFDKLKEWGVGEDTMVVVTGDHGDEQWEAERVGHGGSVRETLIHVPLVIYYPPLFPAGMIEEGVDTLDILPTLADAMGFAPSDDWQGESLLGLAQGVGRGYPRPSISSQYEFAHAMRLGGWKARVAGSGVPQLYDIAADPLERTDLAETRPLERRFLTDALSTFLVYQKNWRKPRWGVASNLKPQMAADLEK